MKRRVVSVFLCVMLAIGALPALSVPAQAASYRLTYDQNTSSSVENMPESQTGDSLYVIAYDVPTRFKYTFLGWSTDRTATQAEYIPGDFLELTANTTLYAVWAWYTTSGVAGYGYQLNLTATGIAANIAFSGQQKWYRVEPTQSTSYTFWSNGGYDPNVTLYNSSGTELAYNDDNPYTTNDWSFRLSYSLESGSTYYIAVSGRTYSDDCGGDTIWTYGYAGSSYKNVTYHTNIPGNDEVFMTQRQYNGVPCDVPWKIPSYETMNFIGWSTDADCTGGELYNPGEYLPEYKTLNLYAIWQTSYLIDSGVTYCYYGSLKYGIQKEWYEFTPKSSGTYRILVDEYTSDDMLTDIYLYDSSMNSIAFLMTSYNYDLHQWDLEAYLSKGNTYYVSVENLIENTIFKNDESSDYLISIVKPSTLSYNANGGSGAPASQTGKYDYDIRSDIPTRFGYNFCYWTDSSSSNGFIGQELEDWRLSRIMLNADVTLYAIWSQAPSASVNAALPENFLLKGQTYYYKFVPTSGGKYTIYSTGSADTRVYLYDANGNELARDDDSGENRNFLLTYNMNAGTTYYYGIRYYSSSATGSIAGKLVRSYSITYNANGGNGAPSVQDKPYGLSVAISDTTPTKSFTITYNANGGSVSSSSKTVNCTFRNWNTSSSGSGTSYSAGASYTVNANATLYAQWTNPTAGTLATPTRSGYTFDGWYTASSGGSKVTSSSAISANTTLYAHWTQTPNNYTISFNAGGGSVSPSSKTAASGTSITLPTPTKSYTITYNANGGSVSSSSKTVNCTFRNWNTSSSGSGTSYSAGASYTVNANATLYAQWTNPTAGTLATPTRSGYEFNGWYTASSGGSKVTSSSAISANTTLYAHWTQTPNNYTISFNAGGGSVSPSSKTAASGTSITLPTPTKSYTITYNANGGSVSSSSKTVNCTFRNWNTSSSGSGTSYSAGASYTVNANATLYAQWTNPTAGTLATPTRSGYEFNGWYTAPSGGSKVWILTPISSNTTLYAQWTYIPVTAVGCELLSAPNKTSYIYKEKTDTTGIALRIYYSDGSTKTVHDTSQMTFSGLTTSSVGKKTVNVFYETVSTSFDITVRYAWWQKLVRIFLLGFIWY